MDLEVITTDGFANHYHKDYCMLHPTTMIDLRIPNLDVASIQSAALFGGDKAFIRCLSSNNIPENTIRLASWMSNQTNGHITTVHIEGIPNNDPLEIVKTVVVTPLLAPSDICDTSRWISSTNATNASLVRSGTSKRNWIENSVKQMILGQVVGIGSVIHARVKSRLQLFKILDIQLNVPISSSIGVIDEDTLLEIKQEQPLKRSVPIACGGMDALVQDICKNIVDSSRQSQAYTRLGIPNSKAIIITGVAGSGKKTVIRKCCGIIGLNSFQLSLAQALSDKEIMESSQARELSHIRTIFDMALQSAPSAVVIQDLDTIAKDREIDSTVLSSALSIICEELNRVRQSDNVFVFAISRDRTKLPDVFQKQNIFQHEFQIPIPLKAQRQEILDALSSNLSAMHVQDNSTLNKTISRVAQMTSGYIAKDLRNLLRSSLLHSFRQERQTRDISGTGPITDTLAQPHAPVSGTLRDINSGLNFPDWKDFSYALGLSKPSQQIEFESSVRSSDLEVYGGYSSLKKRVYQAIHWPITNPETFKRMGVKPPMGLLLYGPSGCGKTLLIQSIAAESSMNFIPIKAPEIFSKYLGETEATLRRLFAMARQIAPCILFFDEMDSIGAKRGWGGDNDSHGSNGVNERVLSTLLNEMDGVEERTNVFVVGCTNQPQAIDDALLRPGRLDQLVYIGYPTLQDRTEIITTIGQRIPLPSSSETITALAKMTVGFSPADLSALFREAAVLTLRRDISSKVVEMSDIEQVIQEMKPSIQNRINNNTLHNLDGEDTIVPDQYRHFQQER